MFPGNSSTALRAKCILRPFRFRVRDRVRSVISVSFRVRDRVMVSADIW